jgi:hypothetical protein
MLVFSCSEFLHFWMAPIWLNLYPIFLMHAKKILDLLTLIPRIMFPVWREGIPSAVNGLRRPELSRWILWYKCS